MHYKLCFFIINFSLDSRVDILGQKCFFIFYFIENKFSHSHTQSQEIRNWRNKVQKCSLTTKENAPEDYDQKSFIENFVKRT